MKSILLWGFGLWIIGYIIGIVLFFMVPQEVIGWVILPFGIAIMWWVLAKRMKLKSFKDYVITGFVWTAIAMLLDYLFIVLLFHSSNYYKPDVYVYYLVTLLFPMIVAKKH